jgi:hypothetical protein
VRKLDPRPPIVELPMVRHIRHSHTIGAHHLDRPLPLAFWGPR